MPTTLDPNFKGYLDSLRDSGQLTPATRRTYGSYVNWIERFGDGVIDASRLSSEVQVTELIAEVGKGFDANPTSRRKHTWNRTGEIKTMLRHYLAFLNTREDFRNTWIFQANPDQYDVVGYVSKYDKIYWSVGHGPLSQRVAVGDDVFIWKSYGQSKDFAGVIAHGHVTEPATDKSLVQTPQNLGDEFWRGDGIEKSRIKAGIQLDGVGTNAQEALLRDALVSDDLLRNSQIIKTRTGAIFLLKSEQGERLRKLWTALPTRQLRAVQILIENQGEFKPVSQLDARIKAMRSIALRLGQPKFRKTLLAAYQSRCAVTGTAIENILEAAHIISYNGESTNHVCNGLLLRSDIHALFDWGLLSVNPETLRVYCSEKIRQETAYGELHGKKIGMPLSVSQHPSIDALRIHFEQRRT